MEAGLFQQLAEYGLLGLILAIVGWIATQLWRDLKSSWESRIVDNKQLVQVMETTNNTYTTLAQATESRARATEAVSEAQMATARALEAQVDVLQRLEAGQTEVVRAMERVIAHAEQVREESRRMSEELRRLRV